ncbi:shikimate kinase [Halobacillus andaensis]|uniref:shikimate kinase n=1 Tax=Halobacillus andaensis TaxID=1176239 RepID=UPI003D72B385
MFFLIGYMGSGKSTIAKELSSALNMEYIEMDETIEKDQQMSITEIFERYGEEYFRELETNLLKSFQGKKVISTGGGVILSRENQATLKNGTVIFLDASFDTIDDRLSNDSTRPLWTGNREGNRQRFNKRRPVYHGLADHIINVDKKDTDTIVAEIIHSLKS